MCKNMQTKMSLLVSNYYGSLRLLKKIQNYEKEKNM
jgi:hypothetical protein